MGTMQQSKSWINHSKEIDNIDLSKVQSGYEHGELGRLLSTYPPHFAVRVH
jgi:hypothetical protein